MKTLFPAALLVLGCLVRAETPYDTVIKPSLVPYEISANRGSAALRQTLTKLHTRASLIMITAHPDDEDGAMLTYESRHAGARVTLLTLNRGEGGANIMSPDFWDALGLVRTQELLAAGRYYGVDQFWTRVCDYGFSKTMDEALTKWKRETVLADVVRVIRLTRPLVITSVFVGGLSDGHGNHQVAGLMAKEAFQAAGDPNRFPEQIRAGLHAWKPLKYYAHLPWIQKGEALTANVEVPVGTYDPLLGESYLQLARQGLGFQKSQNGGTGIPAAGPLASAYHRFGSLISGSEKEQTFFDGVDTSLPGIAPNGPLRDKLIEINLAVEQAISQFSATAPELCAPQLAHGLGLTQELINTVQSSSLPEEEKYGITHELNIKLTQFNNALAESLGLSVRATVLPDHEVDPRFAQFMGEPDTFQMAIPGQSFAVSVKARHESAADVSINRVFLDSPSADWWNISPGTAKGGEWRFRVGASESIPFTRPYFTRPNIEQPYYDLQNPALLNQPTSPYPLNTWVEAIYNGVTIKIGQVVQTTHRETGPGVVFEPLTVGPAIAVQITPNAGVMPLSAKSFYVNVNLHSNVKGETKGVLRLRLPTGWKSDPGEQPFALAKDGEDQPLRFQVIPSSIGAQPYEISAVASFNGREYREGYKITGYPGLRPYFLYQPAVSKVAGVDVTVAPNLKVGYVMGSGDDVAQTLEQLGVGVTFLTAADLSTGDLNRFDVILLGVRTYAARPDLIKNNQRLLEFVRNGGVAVVQYNTPEFDHNYGPYPYKMGNDPEEVTDEESEVKILAAENPIFNWPNRISTSDFGGWIEERGSKFMTSWDEHYQALLETHDPGQPPQRGGLLYARFGKGVYIYNAYAFYRELPEGVPGAFRLMANMLSLAKNPALHAADNANVLQEALQLARAHRYLDADKLMRSAEPPTEEPEAVAFYRLKAAIDSGLGRATDAAADMEKALELAPEDARLAQATARAELAAGDAYESAGDSMNAVREYQEAVKLDPAQEQYWLSLAVEMMQHQTFKPAVEVLERAASRFPKSVRTQTALGLAYYLEDNQPAAVSALMQAMALAPEFGPPRAYLSQVSLAQSGPAPTEVIEALCHYADGHKTDAHANAVCGALELRRAGDSDKRVAERLAIAARAAPKDVLAQCEYAKALDASGQFVSARTAFESCVALEPDSVEGHFRLARVYRELGLSDLAREQAELRTRAEQKQSAENEGRYRNATAFLVEALR